MRNERTHIRNIQTIGREVENITLDELSKQSGLSIGQLRKLESGNSLDCPATDMYYTAKADSAKV